MGSRKYLSSRNLRNKKKHLGIDIEKDSNGVFYLDHAQYIQTIIDKFGLQESQISNMPLDISYFKIARDGKMMHNSGGFQELIGALLYTATYTWPDIAASVSILSQRIKQPTETDWKESKRFVRYLKGTKGLKESKLISSDHGLEVYTDADLIEIEIERCIRLPV